MTDRSADDVSTIAGPLRVEIDRIKGSRFICELGPAADEQVALDLVRRIRSDEPDATHHCWAFRLESGVSRSSDDGEPRGTAGPPILRRLESADLVDVVAVVTRHYGGTNLGAGGLIRAYGAATAAAIEIAEKITRPRMIAFRFTHPYDLSTQVKHVIAGHEAEVVDARYEDAVTLDVRVPATMATGFEASIVEATSGAVRADRTGT